MTIHGSVEKSVGDVRHHRRLISASDFSFLNAFRFVLFRFPFK